MQEAENEIRPSPVLSAIALPGAHYEMNLKYNLILIRSGTPSIFAFHLFFPPPTPVGNNLIKVAFWGGGRCAGLGIIRVLINLH